MTEEQMDKRVAALSGADLDDIAANGNGALLTHHRPHALFKALATEVRRLRAENQRLQAAALPPDNGRMVWPQVSPWMPDPQFRPFCASATIPAFTVLLAEG